MGFGLRAVLGAPACSRQIPALAALVLPAALVWGGPPRIPRANTGGRPRLTRPWGAPSRGSGAQGRALGPRLNFVTMHI